jgi:hypothetical protein
MAKILTNAKEFNPYGLTVYKDPTLRQQLQGLSNHWQLNYLLANCPVLVPGQPNPDPNSYIGACDDPTVIQTGAPVKQFWITTDDEIALQQRRDVSDY